MSSNNAVSNVIPMREFERPPSTQQAVQFERLLQECQNLAMERMAASVAGMLDKADEALWKLAENSTERALRDRYLQAKDKVRSQRRVIEEQFHDNYLAEFERRKHRSGKARDQFSQYDFTSTELDLVADDTCINEVPGWHEHNDAVAASISVPCDPAATLANGHTLLMWDRSRNHPLGLHDFHWLTLHLFSD